MASSQQKYLVAITTDTAGKKKIVEHSQVVKQKIFHFTQIDTDSPKVTIETYGTDDFGEIEGNKGPQKPKRIGVFEELKKSTKIDVTEDIVECPYGDK